ncbi:MAG TPA: class I SAM-dependent methyltransferase [bacterium]|nr:class I SAM-dependent methyltransferase [bacterium]
MGRKDPSLIPWADFRANPNLVRWLDDRAVPDPGRTALKIGCGLGDDAEELAARGFTTTAFDISPTAIDGCRVRFPGSRVRYVTANLFAAPSEWNRAFDLVVESYTLQVLPDALRARAVKHIADFAASRGTLLVITRARDSGDHEGGMPWPLTRGELDLFRHHGLTEVNFEDFTDTLETPPVRRFLAEYLRQGPRTPDPPNT